MSDSRPTSNSKKQRSPTLTYKYAVWREVERADEYPLEADGSQTISELCREYTHIVDDLKWWPYFDIPSCLKRLSWSVDECYGRIMPQWIQNSSLTRHAVVQLALYTCPPFRDIPPAGYPRSSVTQGYIIDESDDKSRDKKPHRYVCPCANLLVEALATALMHYEYWCEQFDSWLSFEIDRDRCTRFLKSFLWLWKNASRRGFAPKNPVLWHNRKLPVNIQSVIQAVESFTYDDYQHTNAPTNKPGDPRAHGNKYDLLTKMKEAFSTHMPTEWRQEATHRALVTIMNQLKITNAQGKEWNDNTVRRFLARGPNSRLSFTVHLTRPNVVPWYTRPE
jgi:hypothetical protein